VWNYLRKKIASHRSFPDAEWALPEGDVAELVDLMKLFEPRDAVNQFRWLFDDQMPHFVEGFADDSDLKDRRELVLKRRIEAFEVIESEIGLDGTIQLAETVALPWDLGVAAGHAVKDDTKVMQILYHLGSGDDNTKKFEQAFVRIKEQMLGFDWVVNTFQKLREMGISMTGCLEFLQALTEKPELWDFIDTLGQEITQNYWKCCYGSVFDVPDEKKPIAIDRLLEAGRPVTALKVACYFSSKLPTASLVKTLRTFATEQSQEPLNLSALEIEEALKELDNRSDCPRDDLVQLEWLYIRLLGSVGRSRPPKLLHQEASNNPEFFAEVIRYIFKSKEGDEEESNLPDEQEQPVAEMCNELLNSWLGCPGMSESGHIDDNILQDWIDKARIIAAKDRRSEIADVYIGHALAHSTKNGKTLPQEAVCHAIDRLNNADINRGFEIEIGNMRGVTSRGAFDGGDQERTLAQLFRENAMKIRDRWPTTASLLDHIATRYDNDAKHYDQRAEEIDLKY
jgi:hypothetical protein